MIEGEARFRDRRPSSSARNRTIKFEIKARRFVIATGSRPVVPQIPGLEQVPYLTNETAFETRERPKHLIVLGGGPVGLELAQAFRRLGSEVTVLDIGPAARDRRIPNARRSCSMRLRARASRSAAASRSSGCEALRQRIEVVLAGDAGETIQGTDLLVAIGRRPNIDALDLQAARIKHEPDRILINKRFRTSNRRVYAIGDVTGLPASTHSAPATRPSLLIRHLLFRLPIRINPDEIPRVTFTDPELAHVGLTDVQARERHGAIRVLRWPYRDNDRAQTEREARGHIKVVTTAKGLILGATIVGAAAAEQITAWTLAINHGLNIRAFAEIVVPYPTYTEAGKKAAITFFTPRLTTTNWVNRVANLLRRFG